MRCLRAIIQYRGGKPDSYSLVVEGTEGRPGRQAGVIERETPFREAYELFPAIKKHWNADGTAKE